MDGVTETMFSEGFGMSNLVEDLAVLNTED